MSARITIVGGGFAGLIAARSLQAQGITDVTVLERAPEVGGLLRSFVAEDPLGDGRPLAFDRGAHFVLATGAPELDALLLAGVTPERYHVFDDSLPEGQFLNGALSVDSGCADARLFGEEIRARVFAELEERVAAEAPGAAPETLRDELLATYGPTATELIFEPAFVKHAGRPTAALHPSMRQYFAATRVIAADRARSAALKADPKWDARLAFAHHEDGSSSIRKFYPRSGGVGLWIAELAEETAKAGARLLAGAAVSAIEVEAGAARAAVLDTGERIETDHLVWTLPPALLARQLGAPVAGGRPNLRFVSTIHLAVDRRPTPGPFWITVFDPAVASYRITLYDNFQTAGGAEGVHRVTVEVLSEGPADAAVSADALRSELIAMGVVPPETRLLWSAEERDLEAFPIVTPGYREGLAAQMAEIEGRIGNLTLVGRLPHVGHTQIAVATHAHREMGALAARLGAAPSPS